MAVHKSQEEKFLLSYFNKLGISPSKTSKQFWEILHRYHDSKLVNEIRNIMTIRLNGAEEGNRLYKLKNQDLRISLDFARYSANLYRNYFEWLMKKTDLKPKRILDLGCDNGIITCFYGLLYPDAEIVGVDICENAISCANKLKDFLKVSNVSFNCIDIGEIDTYYDDGYFDLVTSIRTLHEAIDFPDFPRHWSYNELNFELPNDKSERILKSVCRVLDKGTGIFVSWERLCDIETYLWWVKQLKKNNLYVNLKESKKLRFYELEQNQIMPLLLADFGCNYDSYDEDIIPSYVENILGEKIDFEVKDKYMNESAEVAFNLIEDKEFLFGVQGNYADKSGNQRIEIWKSGDILIFYSFTNVGYRELILYPSKLYEQVKSNLQRWKQGMEASRQVAFWYESINERDMRDMELSANHKKLS